MKKIVFIGITLIIVIAGYSLLTRTPNTKTAGNSRSTPQQENVQNQDTRQATFTSFDKRVQLTYPTDWHITDTTPNDGQGQFGPYTQTWIIQTFPMENAGQGGIPENTVKIDFEIMQGGQNLPLESLIDCQMKTESCERVGIDNELFIKGVTTLNTGMKVIQIATYYDTNVFRATAYIQTGDEQTTHVHTVNTIFDSISFH